MDKERLLRLLEKVDPLIKSQMGLLEYRQFNYSFQEIYTMYEDKVIDIVLKYTDKDFDDLLYITLASIRRHTYHINKSLYRYRYSYVQIEEGITHANAQIDIANLFDELTDSTYAAIDSGLHPLLSIILTPPIEVTQGLTSSTRVPNESYLRYLGVPVTPSNIRRFQKHRNYINNVIKEQIKVVGSKT